jgi:hypothetical protein
MNGQPQAFRPTRKELAMATTMTIPKKEAEAEPLNVDQRRPALDRYRLQVDRQTKRTFKNKPDAERVGSEIKKQFPKVQVSVYDSEESVTTLL